MLIMLVTFIVWAISWLLNGYLLALNDVYIYIFKSKHGSYPVFSVIRRMVILQKEIR